MNRKQKKMTLVYATISYLFFLVWACEQEEVAEVERRSEIRQSADSEDQNDDAESTLPEEIVLSFAWEHADPTVYEYEVYAGPSREELQLVGSYRNIRSEREAEFLDRPQFNIAVPSVDIIATDFGYTAGGNFCTQVIAVNIQGKSEPTATCLND